MSSIYDNFALFVTFCVVFYVIILNVKQNRIYKYVAVVYKSKSLKRWRSQITCG
jgi:hypothetical protein